MWLRTLRCLSCGKEYTVSSPRMAHAQKSKGCACGMKSKNQIVEVDWSPSGVLYPPRGVSAPPGTLCVKCRAPFPSHPVRFQKRGMMGGDLTWYCDMCYGDPRDGWHE